jgi:hypothetical protein
MTAMADGLPPEWWALRSAIFDRYLDRLNWRKGDDKLGERMRALIEQARAAIDALAAVDALDEPGCAEPKRWAREAIDNVTRDPPGDLTSQALARGRFWRNMGCRRHDRSPSQRPAPETRTHRPGPRAKETNPGDESCELSRPLGGQRPRGGTGCALCLDGADRRPGRCSD